MPARGGRHENTPERPAEAGTPARPGRLRGLSLRRGGLYLIVSSPAIPHEELVAAAIDREVSAVQLREKTMAEAELMALAKRLSDLTRGTRTLFIVNDRPDVAAAVGADGVHLGRADARPEDARLELGPGRVVGVTGNTPEEALAALAAGADYIGVGPIFPTATKPDAQRPVGRERIRVVRKAAPGLPIVAIGGIDHESAASVIDAGADYVAVVSAICRAGDPVAAMDGLLDALDG